MCGIAGEFFLKPDTAIFDSINRSRKVSGYLIHRGPDDSGEYACRMGSLTHRRLSIVDIEHGSQPLTNQDETLILVANCEIYNHLELRRELSGLGAVFKTNTDAEVILHSYEQWGLPGVSRLEGQFAFCLLDLKEVRIILCRDHLGKRPLYYSETGDKVIFASEMTALMKNPLCRKEINPSALNSYLFHDYVPGTDTIISNIKKVLPASIRIYSQKKPQGVEFRYWKPDYSKTTTLSFDKCTEKLKELSLEATQRRLMGEVPIGVLSSGGIDSSLVLAFLNEVSTQRLPSFSIGFDEPSYDESRYFKRISEHFQTEFHSVRMPKEFSLERADECFRSMDEPTADPAIIPLYYLSQLTRKRVTVALSGDGSDEIFGGYLPFRANYWLKPFSGILPAKLPLILKPLLRFVPRRDSHLSASYKLENFFSGLDADPVMRTQKWMATFKEDQLNMVCGQAFELPSSRDKILIRDRNIHDFYRITDWYLHYYLANDILPKNDRTSMAFSLEIRSPFLDRKVVEFALSLPPEYQQGWDGQGKRLLKEMAKNMLPREIIKRPKHGLGVPTGKWLKTSLLPWINELSSRNSPLRDLLNSGYIEKISGEHINNIKDHRKRLWSLLILDRWLRQHMS